MAFQGSLQELPLPDILQLVAVSGKTGSFTIENGSEIGQIFLENGHIVHARMGRLEGEEAVYELAIWPEGEFLFTPGEVPGPRTISKSNTSLLMEAARRIDEWQVLARRVPSTALVPVFAEDGGKTSISLNPLEWAVIRKIDGRRSIEQIAVALGSSPFETAKVVYGLVTSGLVDLGDDPGRRHRERLDEMTPEERRAVARQVRERARAYLAGHARAADLESELGPGEEDVGAEGLLRLIRSAEKAVSGALGPHRAKSFADAVTDLMAASARGR